MLSVKELEAFRAFIESGSVTHAAERLNRTQPQVGRLLVALEEAVGFPLFVRQGKRLSATPEGWRFYQEVERVMSEFQSLSRFAEQIRTGTSDHIRILVAPHTVGALVSQALLDVQRRRVALTAEVSSHVRLDIETWITQQHFDVGVCILPIDNPAFDVERFLSIKPVVVMRDTHPLASRKLVKEEDLVDVELVATHTRSLLRLHLDTVFRGLKKKPDVRFEATNGLIACELAAQGLGVVLADPFVALSAGAEHIAIRPFATDFKLEYGFIYPRGRARSNAVREFTEAVKVSAGDRLRENRMPRSLFEFI